MSSPRGHRLSTPRSPVVLAMLTLHLAPLVIEGQDHALPVVTYRNPEF